MDVARIEAISPQKIDWRRLTAKEIIKYEQQGVDVPAQYLQWAQEIRNSLETTDDITYEKALSETKPTTTPMSTDVQSPIDSEASEGALTAPTDESSNTVVEDKTEAQLKREHLENAGISLRTQAKIFTQDSKSNISSVINSIESMMNAEAQSNSEIENLENYMSELLAKAQADKNTLKNEVSNLNNDRGNVSSLSKINQIQAQLQQYGNKAQSDISSTENDLIQYNSVLNSQSDVYLTAKDFGNETVNVGNDLLTSVKGYEFWRILDIIIGRRAVKTGESALTNSDMAIELQSQATSTSIQNISTAGGYKNKVENATGVAGTSQKNQANQDSNKDDSNEIKITTKKESDKTVKTSQNDGTDNTAKASTNIDEILKRKIRRGENINPA